MNTRKEDALDTGTRRSRWMHVAGSVLYWLAVIIVSLALVVGLVLLLESRDASELEGARGAISPNAVRASESLRGAVVWMPTPIARPR